MFILAEEIKARKLNKSSETKKSKYNSYEAASAGNNKNKWSNKKKGHQQSNTNSRVNKNSSMKCTYCGQDVHFAMKCFKNPQGDSYKGKTAISTGGKNVNLMTWTLQRQNNFNN